MAHPEHDLMTFLQLMKKNPGLISVPTKFPEASVMAVGSSLNVTWKSLTASEARGLVTQYKIVYRKQGTHQAKEVTVHGNLNDFIIKGVF